MRILIKRVARASFVDDIVFYTLLNRGWALASGLVTIAMITFYIGPIEQVFYFTFFNLVAIQTLFELGLTYTVTQLVAHEMAALRWERDGTIEGDPKAKGRLASISAQSMNWFLAAALFFVCASVIAGWLLFSVSYADRVWFWLPPLIALAIFTGIKLVITAFEGILEGVGQVKTVAQTRMIGAMIGTVCLWGALASGQGLYGPAAMTAASALFCSVRYRILFRRFVADLLSAVKVSFRVSWRYEVWPLQWRMATSWASGYFIYQLFNPAIFYHLGAKEAGEFGMAMTIVNVIMSICAAWISPRVSPVTTLTAQRNTEKLERMFKDMLKASITVAVTLTLIVVFGYFTAKAFGVSVIGRLPAFGIILALLLGVILNQAVSIIALFIRAKKTDPYVVPSLLSAVVTVACLGYLLPRLELVGAVVAYLAPIVLVSIPVSIGYYRRYLNFKG